MDIIIGAGVSGISYANFTDNEYLILEAESQIGGYCKTIKQDGFTWDYSGHFFHFQNKWVEDLVCANIDKDALVKCQKRTQIKYGNRYVDFPFQKNIHQLPQDEFIDCLYDLFAAKDTDCASFKQMLYAKFGRSIADKFLIPYNEKLYACNLDALDVNAMGRFFPYAQREDIVLNFRRPSNESYNACFTYPQGGAIEYINSLYRNLNADKVCLNERVVGIDLVSKTLQTTARRLRYDRLISTMPFDVLLHMSNVDFDHKVYSANKVLVFNLGFDRKGADRTNHWIYFPCKDTCFYRIGYYDNIFSADRMSLYVELGFERNADIDAQTYRQRVLSDLRSEGIITDHRLVSWHSVVMNPAYCHITQASERDVSVKKDLLRQHDVYSIGRYGSWTYCSIEDNILEARRLAQTYEKHTLLRT
jgi:protoporphyrinogen oxidase